MSVALCAEHVRWRWLEGHPWLPADRGKQFPPALPLQRPFDCRHYVVRHRDPFQRSAGLQPAMHGLRNVTNPDLRINRRHAIILKTSAFHVNTAETTRSARPLSRVDNCRLAGDVFSHRQASPVR